MELEVGMYVRSKYGIAKYIANRITKATIYRVIDKRIVYDNVEDWEDCLLDNEILKARHNKIDLIEVGDYVNGNKIIKKSTDHCGRNILIYGYNFGDRQVAITIYEDEIKSIVTKEQFESMSYKVGD